VAEDEAAQITKGRRDETGKRVNPRIKSTSPRISQISKWTQ
jgi:hypothetical protein